MLVVSTLRVRKPMSMTVASKSGFLRRSSCPLGVSALETVGDGAVSGLAAPTLDLVPRRAGPDEPAMPAVFGVGSQDSVRQSCRSRRRSRGRCPSSSRRLPNGSTLLDEPNRFLPWKSSTSFLGHVSHVLVKPFRRSPRITVLPNLGLQSSRHSDRFSASGISDCRVRFASVVRRMLCDPSNFSQRPTCVAPSCSIETWASIDT